MLHCLVTTFGTQGIALSVDQKPKPFVYYHFSCYYERYNESVFSIRICLTMAAMIFEPSGARLLVGWAAQRILAPLVWRRTGWAAAVGWGAQGQKRGQLPRISQRVTRGGTALSAERGSLGGKRVNILGSWKRCQLLNPGESLGLNSPARTKVAATADHSMVLQHLSRSHCNAGPTEARIGPGPRAATTRLSQ